MSNNRVGLDSQCLSYLLDAIYDVGEPTDALALEKKALIRSWFYEVETFFVTETVMSEVAKIRVPERRSIHESFVLALFHDFSVRNAETVTNRALLFKSTHPEPNDCRILAEAEDQELKVLLTYDGNFQRRLSAVSPMVRLMTPYSYWESLGLPKGAQPKIGPHDTNPLSIQTWWRW